MTDAQNIAEAAYKHVVGQWVAGSPVEQALAANFDPRPLVALVLRLAMRSEVSANLPDLPAAMRYRFSKDARQSLGELAAELTAPSTDKEQQ